MPLTKSELEEINSILLFAHYEYYQTLNGEREFSIYMKDAVDKKKVVEILKRYIQEASHE